MFRSFLAGVFLLIVTAGLAQSSGFTSIPTTLSPTRKADAWGRPTTTAGLQLKIVATNKPGTADSYHFKGFLTNTSSQDLEFASKTESGETTQPLSAFLLAKTKFNTVPKVHASYFGSAMSSKRDDVYYTIGSGKTVTFEWDSYCNCLMPPKTASGHTNPFAACLPEPGEYLITPELNAMSRRGELIVLEAPAFKVTIGSLNKPARPTSIVVLSVDADGQHALVKPGNLAGLKLGEEYLDNPKWPSLQLKIVELYDDYARVEVKEINRDRPHTPDNSLPVGSEFFRIDQVKNNGAPKCEPRHDKYSFGKI